MAGEPRAFGYHIRRTWSDSSSSTDSGSEPGIHVLSSPLHDKTPSTTRAASSGSPNPAILANHRRPNTRSLQLSHVDEVDDDSEPAVAKFTNIFKQGLSRMQTPVEGLSVDNLWKRADQQDTISYQSRQLSDSKSSVRREAICT